VAPYPTLMGQDAPQRTYPLREVFDSGVKALSTQSLPAGARRYPDPVYRRGRH